MASPFRLVPWQTPFLNELCRITLEISQHQPGRAVVVFPHNRPKRYFWPLFHTPDTPCLLPRLFTVTELMAAVREEQDSNLRRAGQTLPVRKTAGLADQVALLRTVVNDLATEDTGLCARLGELDMATFFPWGVRLAAVLEECLAEGLTPADIHNAEGEVADFAAALLSALGRIFHAYTLALDAQGFTTPGMDAYAATSRLDAELPLFLRDRHILLAGFNALNGTENSLFRHLWHHGATVCLHGDPSLAAPGDTPAPDGRAGGCAALARWMTRWGAEAVLSPQAVPDFTETTPQIHFFAGHDLHSQIAALQDDLDELPALPTLPTLSAPPDAAGGVAIALAHADALLPVLHHLPTHNCNVSMGYPLDRSLLSRLVHTVLDVRDSLRTSSSEEAHVYWRKWLELLRHPHIRLLHQDGGHREALQALERLATSSGRFVAPRAIVADMAKGYAPDTAALLHELVDCTLERWATVETPAHMAEALYALCRMLLERGETLWPRFPLDAECLFRLMQTVVPALRDNLLADTVLPWPLLRTLLESLIAAERVPFEADPITGVQVLGMLETRLLHFDHVFVLDATDDHLPGPPDQNPLLPDTLRATLGLAGSRGRDMLAAYTFHRLLAGARHVHLYWQQGDRKQPSRLVEECVWREEQRLGKLLKAGEAPFRAPNVRVKAPSHGCREVIKSPVIRQCMEALLSRRLSATALDTYLTCPLRFYYERLCRLAPPEEVNEGDDPMAVGNVVHQTLFRFYEPWKGRVFRRTETSADELRRLFLETLANEGLDETLPPESAAMLRVAGPERLRRFLLNQPEEPLILMLETALSVPLAVDAQLRTLTGTLDRVDKRPVASGDTGVFILDYKTGKLRAPSAIFWKNDDFWNALAHPGSADPDTLLEQATAVGSLQLPLYLWLYHSETGVLPVNAAFVELLTDGKERPLFPDAIPEDRREQAVCRDIPHLLRFVLRHMAESPRFFPRQGAHCRWCSVNKLCRV